MGCCDNIDRTKLINILMKYISPELHKLYDFNKIIDDAEFSNEEKTIVKFELYMARLYLYHEDYSYYDVEPY